MANMRHATPKKQPRSFRLPTTTIALLGKLTRYQVVALSIAACSIVLGVSSSFTDQRDSSNSVATTQPSDRKTIELALNNTDTTAVEQLTLPDLQGSAEQKDAAPKPAAHAATKTVTKTIKAGDNLSELFLSVGLSASDVYRITHSGAEGKALTKMFPGESLAFEFSSGDELQRITRIKSPLESIHFNPVEDGFTSNIVQRSPEIKQIHRSAYVEHSLSRAAEKAGLAQGVIMNMANIFGGVMDFVLDVRAGDKFTVIYEEHYLDGKKIKDGNIIAAQYVNRGKTYNAFRYVHSNGETGYYNEDGESMRKVFLRAPLDFTRVSSGFNLKRLHPITKKVRPHRGIDYAAPRGTPVFSVGDGRVIASGYSKANGKYVFIKHGEAYTTKYLHLHRRSVKKGQRIKQGQIIGQVGCTGLCTGPHLHYEFLLNGVHRNPRTIMKKLPKAKRLAKIEIPTFSTAIADTRDILSHLSNQFELASIE